MVNHNHNTRDRKPYGACRGCDEMHDRAAMVIASALLNGTRGTNSAGPRPSAYSNSNSARVF